MTKQNKDQNPHLSIIIPVYNSADIFPELYVRLKKILIDEYNNHEIITIVDGNEDNCSDIIASYCNNDRKLKMILFSKNFGHQSAITAGLENASGCVVVTMDDDLEDPPEEIPTMLRELEKGYDLIYGIRKKRKVSIIKKFLFYSYYRILNYFSSIDMPYDSGDFCVMNKKVVDTLNNLPERNRFIRGLRSWAGFKQKGYEYERGIRYSGTSGYSLRKYIKFSIDGILSFSNRPLTIVSIFGFFACSISFILGITAITLKIFGFLPDNTVGWTSLFVIIVFIGGIQLISIGVIGQYIGRIYDEVKNRPMYVIKEKIGFK